MGRREIEQNLGNQKTNGGVPLILCEFFWRKVFSRKTHTELINAAKLNKIWGTKKNGGDPLILCEFFWRKVFARKTHTESMGRRKIEQNLGDQKKWGRPTNSV